MIAVWKLLRCYVSGRHEYRVSCEPGVIYLQCPYCGRRSSGWAIDDRPSQLSAHQPDGMDARLLGRAHRGPGPRLRHAAGERGAR